MLICVGLGTLKLEECKQCIFFTYVLIAYIKKKKKLNDLQELVHVANAANQNTAAHILRLQF